MPNRSLIPPFLKVDKRVLLKWNFNEVVLHIGTSLRQSGGYYKLRWWRSGSRNVSESPCESRWGTLPSGSYRFAPRGPPRVFLDSPHNQSATILYESESDLILNLNFQLVSQKRQNWIWTNDGCDRTNNNCLSVGLARGLCNLNIPLPVCIMLIYCLTIAPKRRNIRRGHYAV